MFIREYNRDYLISFVEEVCEKCSDSTDKNIKKSITRLNNFLYNYLDESRDDKNNDLQGIFGAIHELKAFIFLRQFGSIVAGNDRKLRSDFRFKKKYVVECASPTLGIDDNFIAITDSYKKDSFGTIDLNEKMKLNANRLTSLIKEKKKQFMEQLIEGIISEADILIVFLGMGSLEKGYAPLHYNAFGNEVVYRKAFRSHIPEQSIDSGSDYRGVFLKPDYAIISGMLFSTCNIDEYYTLDNTTLHLNPHAKNRIIISDFRDFVYWDFTNDRACPFKNDVQIEIETPKFF